MDICHNHFADGIEPELFRPLFFRLARPEERKAYDTLLAGDSSIVVHAQLEGQLRELIKSMHPSIKIPDQVYPERIKEHLKGVPVDEYGVWVYYPWSKRMVHLLDEAEFVAMRTNRNQYKITQEEQDVLATRKIGVIGLSVGQSIALTLAMERVCGELRLADFDTAELTNLNRIRTGVHNLGLHKTIIAAREIAEIDPFLKVLIFSEGVTDENIDPFFTAGGKLDLLVEVCDGLDIKIISRYKARSLGIPVVMDTNDRGMVDVERFDLEPERPVLHGLAEGLDPKNIKDLTNEEKIPYILKMVDAERMSARLKASMVEVEQSINTWPQLASSVVLGGAVTTDVCRRILLDQYHESGRYYIDLDHQIADRKKEETTVADNPWLPLTLDMMRAIASHYFASGNNTASWQPDESQLDQLIDAIIAAPSEGNCQPWKLLYEQGVLFLFHDRYLSHSSYDDTGINAFISLGAALENMHLQAGLLGLEDVIQQFPLSAYPVFIAAVRFIPAYKKPDDKTIRLAQGIFNRSTNRDFGEHKTLPVGFLKGMQYIVKDFEGVQMSYVDSEQELNELIDILASCNSIRLMQEEGHRQFFKQMRWDKQEAAETGDGIVMMPHEILPYRMINDWNAVKLLSKWGKGGLIRAISHGALKHTAGIALFSVAKNEPADFIMAGKAIERSWIFANIEGVAVCPLSQIDLLYENNRAKKTYQKKQEKEISLLRERFINISPLKEENGGVFLMRLFMAGNNHTDTSVRRSRKEIFYKTQC